MTVAHVLTEEKIGTAHDAVPFGLERAAEEVDSGEEGENQFHV